MRNKVEYMVSVALLSLIVILGATAMQIYNRQAEEQTMDQMEAHYDADGPFVMIDSTIGLIGLYDSREVIGHIWADDAKGVPDGVFRLVIHSDRIGLGNPGTEWIEEIRISKSGMKKIEELPPGIPVLVY